VVQGVQQLLGGAEAVAVGPAQQQQQTGQRLELPPQQNLQPGELLPLDQVQARHLGHTIRPSDTFFIQRSSSLKETP